MKDEKDELEKRLRGRVRALQVGALFVGLGYAGFAVAHGFAALSVAELLLALCIWCLGPFYAAWVLRVPGRFRATANSLAQLGFRAAYMITAPVSAAVLNGWGLQSTFVLAGMAMLIFGALVIPLIAAVRLERAAEPLGERVGA